MTQNVPCQVPAEASAGATVSPPAAPPTPTSPTTADRTAGRFAAVRPRHELGELVRHRASGILGRLLRRPDEALAVFVPESGFKTFRVWPEDCDRVRGHA